MKTSEVNKLALNNQDDKRLSIDGIASYAIGHYKFEELSKRNHWLYLHQRDKEMGVLACLEYYIVIYAN